MDNGLLQTALGHRFIDTISEAIGIFLNDPRTQSEAGLLTVSIKEVTITVGIQCRGHNNAIVTKPDLNGNDRTLYLALPVLVYESFFQQEFLQISIEHYQIPLLIYEPRQEVIEQWIN
jgi:hypothetical protein